jgi:arylsulfatase A-like enzyme
MSPAVRIFVSRGLAFLATLLLLSCSNEKTKNQVDPVNPAINRPNFIFIAVDDLNIYNTVLGALPGNFLEKIYPDEDIRAGVISNLTPKLNEFANESLVFRSAFCPYPLCGPSRTAVLTGVPPHISGYLQHDRHFRAYETLTRSLTLPQYLKQNGYYTAGIGKVFHKGRSYLDRGYFSDWPDRLYSWDDWVEVHSGTGTTLDPEVEEKETLSRYWRQGARAPNHFTRFGVSHIPREKTNDYLNAKHIADLILHGKSERMDLHGEIQSLELPDDKPYFLACGLFAPHLPWMAQQEFYDLFPEEDMAIDRKLIEWIRDDLMDLSPSGKAMTRQSGFTNLLEYGMEIDGEDGDINAWKAAFRAYLATIAYSDANLGLLLQAVRENPRKEHTIVIFWSDHGYHLGDKNRTGKTTLWEAANHCNLVIFDPTRPNASSGLATPATVSLQDLYPTLVSLAGLPRPAHVHGVDLTPLLEDPDREWDRPVLNTNGKNQHAVRTSRYRYLRYANGDQELYDLQEDPLELVNLAGLPLYAPKLDSLDRIMEYMLHRKASSY